jgi:hypothetical protein
MATPAQPPGTGSPTKDGQAPAAGQPAPQKKKFHNGWTHEIEKLMAQWSDHAKCYAWMHEKTERICKKKDYAFMFPVIILSTVTGAANFALDSVIKDPEQKTYAQMGLGGLSIVTGIISTIANRLGYANSMEAHRMASQRWGKFERQITVELALHPNERADCMYFLKTCRTELDRLLEQRPTDVPIPVIDAARKEFEVFPVSHKPKELGGIETTRIFVDTKGRLGVIAKEAAIMIAQKKGILKQITLDDLEPRISRVLEHVAIPALKEDLAREIKKAAREAATAAVERGAPVGGAAAGVGISSVTLIARQAAERAQEMEKLAKTGVVAAMRRQMGESSAAAPAPKKVELPGMVIAEPEQVTIEVDSEEEESEEEEDDELMAPSDDKH